MDVGAWVCELENPLTGGRFLTLPTYSHIHILHGRAEKHQLVLNRPCLSATRV